MATKIRCDFWRWFLVTKNKIIMINIFEGKRNVSKCVLGSSPTDFLCNTSLDEFISVAQRNTHVNHRMSLTKAKKRKKIKSEMNSR